MELIAGLEIKNDIDCFAKEWQSETDHVVARTSGSTGPPKSIRLYKSDMIQSSTVTNRFFGISSESTLFCPLSIDYIAAKMMYVRAAVARCKVIFEKPSTNPFGSGIVPDGSTIDLMAIVPAQIDATLCNLSKRNIQNLIIGGSAINKTAENKILQSSLSGWSTYGMTETCSHVALRKIGEQTYKALPGFSFSQDKRGCLVINSETMSFGQLTTNDIVTLHGCDAFTIEGRVDNVIISGGEKISLEQIEQTLDPLPGVTRFYATGIESDRWGTELVLVCEKSDNASEIGLLEYCRRLLPRHKVPKRIFWVDKIAVTDRGKLVRTTPDKYEQ